MLVPGATLPLLPYTPRPKPPRCPWWGGGRVLQVAGSIRSPPAAQTQPHMGHRGCIGQCSRNMLHKDRHLDFVSLSQLTRQSTFLGTFQTFKECKEHSYFTSCINTGSGQTWPRGWALFSGWAPWAPPHSTPKPLISRGLTPGPQRGPLVTQQISVWQTVHRIQSQPSFFCTTIRHCGQCMASPCCSMDWGGAGVQPLAPHTGKPAVPSGVRGSLCSTTPPRPRLCGRPSCCSPPAHLS